jgi:hypothetical protein
VTPELADNRLKHALIWTGVVILNVPLSLLLGAAATNGHGNIGMAAGVVLVWVAGLVIGRTYPAHGRALTRGGIVVAAVQPLVFCHFILGLIVVGVWQRVRSTGLFREPGWVSELDAFAVTVLMAQPLLLAAWVFGGGLKLLFAPAVARTGEEADYLDGGPATEQKPEAFPP